MTPADLLADDRGESRSPVGGEMGDRIRAFDWSVTALGPMSSWPPHFRTALGICLASQAPTAVCWGESQIILYNDGWRALLTGRRLTALGRGGEEVAGTAIASAATRVLATGATELHRNDAHEYALTPIFDGAGFPAGVFVAATVEPAPRAALLESEERYRTLFDSIDDGFCILEIILDADGRAVDYRFVQLNRVFEQQTGLANATGRTALEMVPNLERWWIETYAKVAFTGQSIRFENGSEPMGRWFRVYASRVGGPGSLQVALVFTDISETRKIEASVRRTARLDAFRVTLADAIRRLADPVDIQRAAARVVGEHLAVNRVAYVEIAADGDEIAVTESYTNGVPILDRPLQLHNFGPALGDHLNAGRTAVHHDVRIDATEEERSAFAAATVVAHVTAPLLKGGRFVAALSVQHASPRDWSTDDVLLIEEAAERTWAAMEQARAQRATEVEAAAMNQLYELVSRLQNAPDLPTVLHDLLDAAIVLVGSDMGAVHTYDPIRATLDIGAYRGFSQAFIARFGSMSVDMPSAAGEAFRSRRRVIIEDYQSDPRLALNRETAVQEGCHGVHATPIIGSNGEPLGVLSTHYRTRHRPADRALRMLDLYARQAAQFIERIRADRALREADRRKDEFLATLAHELRNPLAPLRNGLQIIKLAKHDPEAVGPVRIMMERQLEQLVRLVDDLLDVSRISRGRIELRRDRVNLATAVRNAVESSRPVIDELNHTFTIVLPDPPIYVDGDVTRLAQVFANLLNNAAKYTDRGGRIALTVERRDNVATVSVRDTGVGIPAPMLPTIFEMFTQVNQSIERSQGGLGIGLTLVRRLVEMHGGSVEARSEGDGRGSEFLVHLPIAALEAAPASRPSMELPTMGGRRILVVDDNVDSASSLAMVLSLAGNETRTANDGLAGISTAESFRPEIILLDIGMPLLNGYEACRRIRGEPWGRDIVIVALTGWGQEGDRRRSEDAGFDYHLVKPVEPAAIAKIVAGLDPTS